MRECLQVCPGQFPCSLGGQKRFAVVLSIHRRHEVSPHPHPVSLTNAHNYSMLYVICKPHAFIPNTLISLTDVSIQGT